MMNKMFKNQKLLLVTELIFHNKPKANGKILLSFCWGNYRVIFQVGLKIHHHCSNLNRAYAWRLSQC